MLVLRSLRLLRPGCVRHSSSGLPKPPALAVLSSAEDMNLARAWITLFLKVPSDDLPRDAIQISYSRSSGPGGQNVNKVSTKATIRLTLSSTTSWLPRYTTSNLLRSQHHTSGTILINSSAHRTQPQNLADALAKMKGVILDAAREGLVGATSEGQKRKVEGLEERDRVRTMMQKKERKGVKSGRRDSGGDY